MSQFLQRTAASVRSAGGYVSDDLIVHEVGGELACGAGGPVETPRVLIEYPKNLSVPVRGLRWRSGSGDLEFESGFDSLTSIQRNLLELWLELVRETRKLQSISRNVPSMAIKDAALREHLAQGGHPDLRQPPANFDAKQILLGWHCSGGKQQRLAADLPATENDRSNPGEAHPDWRLIPLKHLVNHHPDGAPQVPRPGRIAVVTSPISSEQETFENYGDLDALHLLMRFGYVDSTARVVHSVPVEVESSHLGTVAIGRRPPRYPKLAMALNELPPIRRTPSGLHLRYLSARAGNRAATARLLSMVVQSAAGMTSDPASAEAERLLDAILDSNMRYYAQLDSLLVQADAASIDAGEEPPTIHQALRQMSALQQQRLMTMWGR